METLTKPSSNPAGNSSQRPIERERNLYLKLQLKLFFEVIKKGKVSLRKLVNVLLCDLTYALKWKKGAPSPYILSLELWNECNAGCLFCRDHKGKIHDINPQGTTPIAKGKMPAETAMDII